MGIIWLDKALDDVATQTNYIDVTRPASAAQLREVVLRAVEYIAHFPKIGHPGRRPGTFEYVLPDWPFIIIYQIRPDDVAILAVFHTSLPPGLAYQLGTEGR